jgi:ribonuclease HII
MLKNFVMADAIVAGCDEAGRGCLSGPVCAAAVILPDNYIHPFLNDSKQLSSKVRSILKGEIINTAIAWAVAMVDNEEIDKINILNASILAMHKALDKLTVRPDYIIVDGNRFKPYQNKPYNCIVKGDGKYFAIAAASILAKTFRDEYMLNLHTEYPCYGWDKNKGYPTEFHRNAILKYGTTPYHRKSFKLYETQLELKF